MNRAFDMLVTGAGPAGLCAALRLNHLGHRVLLVERSPLWPRPQIGEALTPGVRNIIDYLDAHEVLESVPILTGKPTRVRWTSESIETVAHDGAVVARAAFDAALLRLAVARGVEVLRPASVAQVDGAPGAWRVQIATSDGLRHVDAHALLDARGRQSRREPQRLHARRLSTVWAETAMETPAAHADAATRVEALDDGWMWGAALPGGRYRVMFTFDPAARDDAVEREPESVLRHACARSALFRDMAGVRWCDAPRMCVSTPYVDALAWQDGRIRLGDAAFALDPISSSGVEKAMRFSLQAAIAINTWCRASDASERELAQRFYESRLIEGAARHLAWTAGYYRQAWCAEAPFWHLRSTPALTSDTVAISSPGDEIAERVDLMTHALQDELARVPSNPPQSSEPAPLPPLPLHSPIRFARDTGIVVVPCATGDRVTAHPALQHPGLDRPVAFWNGVALFPLLDMLTRATHPLELIAFLGRSMDAARAQQLLEWLWSRQMVEPVVFGA
ncbi:flavin-dependent monooxygenase QhpG [Burkholderia lata]|uniref:Tryptophan halogenase n=1 Tax=Burkholderia lata (strain ATCC 17760 / DSM 23089 / LMG 22485 / NCIMB 9086 / R18194 / 383) TaxID=482957 RepID=A0A6P2WWC9_BURL3|nr:tryptophan 7-halogenase [Burkholderia lata]VWD01351.1 tryptophan halogenase [Burkholderia lata]